MPLTIHGVTSSGTPRQATVFIPRPADVRNDEAVRIPPIGRRYPTKRVCTLPCLDVYAVLATTAEKEVGGGCSFEKLTTRRRSSSTPLRIVTDYFSSSDGQGMLAAPRKSLFAARSATGRIPRCVARAFSALNRRDLDGRHRKPGSYRFRRQVVAGLTSPSQRSQSISASIARRMALKTRATPRRFRPARPPIPGRRRLHWNLQRLRWQTSSFPVF